MPEPVRQLPPDIAAVVGLTLFVNAATFLPVIRETPVRIVLGLLFVLFVPGYTLIAALFPEGGSRQHEDEPDSAAVSWQTREGITGIERMALSFGLNIAIVSLIGLALNFTPGEIRLVPIMVVLSAVTLVAAFGATSRRWELPVEKRFRVPYRQWYANTRTNVFRTDTRMDVVLNVLLVACMLLAVASVGYAVAVPEQGEQFTEFYLLTENTTGDLVADNYPTEFTAGEEQTLVVGVENHERESVSYTVITELQRVETTNNTTEVQEVEELHRFEPTIGDNETWQRQHQISPMMSGEQLRLQYRLYRGSPPADGNSPPYRELHLWVNVSR